MQKSKWAKLETGNILVGLTNGKTIKYSRKYLDDVDGHRIVMELCGKLKRA